MEAETDLPSRFHVKSLQVRDDSHLWGTYEGSSDSNYNSSVCVCRERGFVPSALSDTAHKHAKAHRRKIVLKKKKKCAFKAVRSWAQHREVQMTSPQYVKAQPLGQHCHIPL